MSKTFRGKGAGRARIAGKGSAIRVDTREAIGKLGPRTTGYSSAVNADSSDLQRNMGKAPPGLKHGENFIEPNLPIIEENITALKNLFVNLEKRIEIEARLLNESDPRSSEKFLRVHDWIKAKFPSIGSELFREQTFKIPETSAGIIPNEIKGNYVIRTSETVTGALDDSYLKLKTTLNLASVANTIPRLGVSVEIPKYPFDMSTVPGRSESIKSRWSYPIRSSTLHLLNDDYLPDDQISIPLGQDEAFGTIDMTITSTNGVYLYSIEFELLSSTIGEVVSEPIYPTFGGVERREFPPTYQHTTTLTRSQMHLMDTVMKILITVINRSGIFLTTPERESIHSELNSCFNINSSSNQYFLLNKPKDLQSRDMSWLSPEDSELFMSLGDYDKSADWNGDVLRQVGLYKPLMSIDGGYYVSLKADGTRYFLYFGTNGIYLINVITNIITQITGINTKDGRFFNILPKTVLDVEVIGDISPDGRVVGQMYQILVFDALAVSGVDIRNETYTIRLKHIDDVISYLKDDSKLNAQILSNGQDHPDRGLHLSQIIKVDRKPVWRLPHPSNIPKILGESSVDRHFKVKSLAIEFYSILGDVAILSLKSNQEDLSNVDLSNDIRGHHGIKQNTNGIEWHTDGLIFTPAERPYLENGDTFHQNRIVRNNASKNYSLVRKWKPVMTIDFRVGKSDGGALTLLSDSSVFGPNTVFRNDEYPWNGNAELNDDMLGQIWEFKWDRSKTFSDYAFIPVRERVDKSSPNGLEETAIPVWKLINSPLTLKDLQGRTLTNMKRYHNRAKIALLSEMPKLFPTQGSHLLDLGSGRGGDLSKWRGFSTVYAVEPDLNNLREFISRKDEIFSIDYSRYSTINSSDVDMKSVHYSRAKSLHGRSTIHTTSRRNVKVNIINAKAEDLLSIEDRVPLRKINCVTVFNALTFFYDTLQHLQELIRTISHFLVPGGYCYMIAFDGELLINSMQDLSNKTDGDEIPTHNHISTENISISKAEDPSCRKIWIKIEGGIVRGQYEYLINVRELIQIMDSNGFRLIEERYLNEETLLSEEEYWFSSMFKVLKFRYFSNPIKIEIETFLEAFKEKMEGNLVIAPLDPNDPPQLINSSSLAQRGISNLLRYGNPGDGSCYVHAILRAFAKNYKNTTIAERQRFVISIRKEMAANYTEEIHNSIGGGFFVSSGLPAYAYANVKESIGRFDEWVSNHIMGFIGEQLGVNVYILRGTDAQIYHFGDTSNHTAPGRLNIVLYWINDNHYETVGQLEANNLVRLVFPDDHPLIQAFRQV